MSEELRNILLIVCALGCTCAGIIGFVIFGVIRFTGSQILPMITDLLGGGRGNDNRRDDTPTSARAQGVSAAEALRQRVKGVDFGTAAGAAAAAATAFAALSQNQQQQQEPEPPYQAPARRQTPTTYTAQNDPLTFPGQPPAPPAGRFSAQSDPLAFPGQPPARPQAGYTTQNAPLGYPNQPAYPAQTAPRPGFPQAPQPPGYPPANPSLTPLTGRPAGYPAQSAPPGARPTLSAGRAPSLGDDPLDANAIPGLRNQRRHRRNDDEIYDDGDASDWGDLLGGDLLGGGSGR